MLFTNKPKELSPEDAAAALAEGKLMLVGVRNADERVGAHVAGSRHLPLDELPGRLGELATDTPVGYVCRSGARSSRAACVAANHRIQALNVRGGMLAWEKAGLATQRARNSA